MTSQTSGAILNGFWNCGIGKMEVAKFANDLFLTVFDERDDDSRVS